MPATLRLTGSGVNAVGGEEAEGFLRERQSQRHIKLEAAFIYGVCRNSSIVHESERSRV